MIIGCLFGGKRMKKAYVVFKGRKPGIYKSWDECRAQVDGYSGPVFRGYESMEEAEKAYASGNAGYASKYGASRSEYRAGKPEKKTGETVHKDFRPDDSKDFYMVHSDGGARGNQNKKGKMSGYGYVVLDKNYKIIEEGYGAAIDATNNQMELQGAIEGLKRVPAGAKVYFMTDSVYVYSGFAENFPDEPRYKKWEANGWKNTSKKTPENIEQIKEIYELGCSHSLECIPRDYELLANGKGKYTAIAHGDLPDAEGKWKNPYNKICDYLANMGEDDAEKGKCGAVRLIEDGKELSPKAVYLAELDEKDHAFVVDAAGRQIKL